jgi:hypothetical protein
MQTIPILTENRGHPHPVVRVQTDKPAEQQVVFQLLHQHPLTEYRTCSSKARSSFSGAIDGRPKATYIRFEQRRQYLQGNIRHQSDCPQWMIRRHSIFGRKIAEHRTLLNASFAHRC